MMHGQAAAMADSTLEEIGTPPENDGTRLQCEASFRLGMQPWLHAVSERAVRAVRPAHQEGATLLVLECARNEYTHVILCPISE